MSSATWRWSDDTKSSWMESLQRHVPIREWSSHIFFVFSIRQKKSFTKQQLQSLTITIIFMTSESRCNLRIHSGTLSPRVWFKWICYCFLSVKIKHICIVLKSNIQRLQHSNYQYTTIFDVFKFFFKFYNCELSLQNLTQIYFDHYK